MSRGIARGAAALTALALVAAACDSSDEEASDARAAAVSITNLSDGDEVTSSVALRMEAENFTVEPAGEVNDGAGHFHVMVDVGCVEPGETIPGDTDGYHHFGKAQTDAELELEPGEHTLCLQAGDGAHTALDLTDEVTITVTEG